MSLVCVQVRSHLVFFGRVNGGVSRERLSCPHILEGLLGFERKGQGARFQMRGLEIISIPRRDGVVRVPAVPLRDH